MEQDITNWKNLWKTEKSTSLNINKLIIILNKVERKAKLERKLIFIVTPITILLLASLIPLLNSMYYVVAILLITIGMLIIVIQSYKSKHNSVDLNASLNNQIYVKNLIDKLKQRMLTTSKYMWFYAFFLISGINVGYVYILEIFQLSTFIKIIIHVAFTAMMFFLMYYSIEKRKKENNEEIVPLIDFLENLT